MIMQHDIPWLLLEKYFENQTNNLENQKIKEWLESASENSMIMEQLQSFYHENGSLPIEFSPNVTSALSKITSHISQPQKTKFSTLWWKIACVFILLIAGWWFIHSFKPEKKPSYATVAANTNAVNSFELADGSRIWINKGSEVKYLKEFGKTREVYLKGEAYFEIAHDPEHPFIVHSGNTKTRVLGTKFNIRALPAESLISVTVTEGKVQFGSNTDKDVFLTLGARGVYNKQTGQVTQKLNTDPNFLAWKTLQFSFDSQSLEAVFKTLSDVYRFNYQFENPKVRNRRLTARFNQRPLKEIIETISVSAEINVTSEDSIYYIH
jgi:ferric-dicitrate binding protein FerR (iron transport regulator)